MKRTDIHRPSAIIPSDYEFVSFEYTKIESFGDCEMVLRNRAVIDAHMKRTGGKYSSHEHGGNCMVCGSPNAIYTILFYHSLTNTYVRMGSDCAEKTEMSYGDFNAFQQEVRHYNGIAKGKKAAAAKWQEAGLTEALTIVAEFRSNENRPTEDAESYAAWFREWKFAQRIADMLRTTEMYATLSPKMIDAIRKLTDLHKGVPAAIVKREEEKANAADCPSGRVVIEGEVVSLKFVENDFGGVEKMTVRDITGFMIFVSVPSGVTVERGDKVKLIATVTVSDRDPKFGFGKRPAAVKGSDTIVVKLHA